MLGRQLLAFRRTTVVTAGSAAARSAAGPGVVTTLVLGDTAADDARYARRARVRSAGVDLGAVAVAALRLGRPLALGSVVVGDAAADLLVLGRRRPARVRYAGCRTGGAPALTPALVGGAVFALAAAVVRQAARHLARVDAVVRDVVVEHVLAVLVGHLQVLAARVGAERLVARAGAAAEAGTPVASRVGGERPDAHATQGDGEGRPGVELRAMHHQPAASSVVVDHHDGLPPG